MSHLAHGETLTLSFGKRYLPSNDVTVFLSEDVRATADVFDGHASVTIKHAGGSIVFLMATSDLSAFAALVGNAVDSALDVLPTSPINR